MGLLKNVTDESRISLAFNVLANLSERDAYKLDFVKNERWLDDASVSYTVNTDGSNGKIDRRMSK